MLGRGCIDLKDQAFTLLWAYSISDWLCLMTSAEARSKVGPKSFGLLLPNMVDVIPYEWFWWNQSKKMSDQMEFMGALVINFAPCKYTLNIT